METTAPIKIVDKNAVTSIKISASYYGRINQLLEVLINSNKDTYLSSLENINNNKIVSDEGEILDDLAYALETVFILTESIEMAFEKDGLTSNKDITIQVPDEVAKYFKG